MADAPLADMVTVTNQPHGDIQYQPLFGTGFGYAHWLSFLQVRSHRLAHTGPCISGFINQNTTWRWTFYLLIAASPVFSRLEGLSLIFLLRTQWSGVELALIYLFAPETYKPQVLKIKAKQ
jgi:hypothetical protein